MGCSIVVDQVSLLPSRNNCLAFEAWHWTCFQLQSASNTYRKLRRYFVLNGKKKRDIKRAGCLLERQTHRKIVGQAAGMGIWYSSGIIVLFIKCKSAQSSSTLTGWAWSRPIRRGFTIYRRISQMNLWTRCNLVWLPLMRGQVSFEIRCQGDCSGLSANISFLAWALLVFLLFLSGERHYATCVICFHSCKWS